jgi:guanine deaminase
VDARTSPEQRGTPDSRIDWKTAFHLATAGGAKALDLPVGRFEPGCYFDAIAIDTETAEGTIRLFDDDLEAILQKIIYTASRQNIADVWVAGRRVAGAAQ